MGVFNEERARTYDAGARTVMAGYEALHEVARDCLTAYVDVSRAARIGLVGVGTGYEAELLRQRCPEWSLIGVDPSQPMLALARQRLQNANQVDLRLGVLEEFPDLTELDAILSIGVVHHLPSRDVQVQWCHTVGQRLKRGGLLVVGCQVGPYAQDSPQVRTLAARWRFLGLSAEEIQERLAAFLTQTLPPTLDMLREWFAAAGLNAPELLFRTGYFHLMAAQKH